MLFYTKIFKILLRLDRNRLDNEKFLAPINLVLLSKPIVPYTTPVSDKLNKLSPNVTQVSNTLTPYLQPKPIFNPLV